MFAVHRGTQVPAVLGANILHVNSTLCLKIPSTVLHVWKQLKWDPTVNAAMYQSQLLPNDGSVRFKVLFMEMCVLSHMAGVYRRTFKIAVVLSAPAASAGALHTLPPLRTAITTFLETSERARERQHSFLPQQASICLPLRERSTRSAFRP